ncbi:NlpC/P60 family protein [Spirillospora sp. NPDC127200]
MPLLLGGVGAGLAVLVVMLAAVGATFGGMTASAGDAGSCQSAPGKAAAFIPPSYLALYVQAGGKYGIPWNVLAAVGHVESNHGQGTSPGIKSGRNSAGAAGPMQFMPGTWKAFGVDGNGDGRKDVYDPADAIPGAAAYLKHNGAPGDLHKALFGYNHADWYVKKVLAQAAAYGRGADASGCADMAVVASGRAAVAVRAALRWLGTPYSWGGGGLTGPSLGIGRGAGTTGFDCSGLTRYAWHQAGASLPRTSQEQWRALPHVPAGQQAPGDLVFFEGSGGSATAPGHVGLVIAPGRMVEAPRTGLKVRVASITGRSDLVGYARPGLAKGGRP